MRLIEYLRANNPYELSDAELIEDAEFDMLQPFAEAASVDVEELRERMLMHLGGRENFDDRFNDPPFEPNPYQLGFDFLKPR